MFVGLPSLPAKLECRKSERRDLCPPRYLSRDSTYFQVIRSSENPLVRIIWITNCASGPSYEWESSRWGEWNKVGQLLVERKEFIPRWLDLAVSFHLAPKINDIDNLLECELK